MSPPPPYPQLEVLPLDGDRRAWDELVTRAECSSFCHLAGWREILSDVLGAECLYWQVVDADGALHGILPLVRVRSRIFGHYLVSLPFLNYGGPLGSQAAQDRLAQEAVTEARRTRADLLELRTRDPGGFDLPVSSRKITVLLPLPSDAETLFTRFPAKLRSQIRRPMKEGLEVRFGPEQREPFYEVFARTMRDLGTPVLPRAFFERVSATFADLVVFGVVYRGEQPLAAGCGFVWRGEFEMTWAGALRESRTFAANMLLYWTFMEQMIARGVRMFNFGRCTPGGGTHRFKKQWGGVDVPLPWLQWSARERTVMPTPDRPAFRLASALWRRLPLALTKKVGPVIARQIP
ncbi:MAG TPA: FemAB family XrtA/PEP-CTERM system-associated protein [Gemmatimonadales bacterium]